tara:strand:- start:183 stop:347 length:165 start_codon:yes stop_codon:yes gene_type:complete
MPYKIIKSGNSYQIKNLSSGKVGKLKYKKKENAQIQINNRLQYEKYISTRKGNS